MDAVSSILIAKALDGLAMRQLYTAQNIANANSQAYSPVKVEFENRLQDAAAKGIASIEQVKPEVSYSNPQATDSGMRLDLELAAAAQTAMRYGALVDVLSRQMSLTRSVITGGR